MINGNKLNKLNVFFFFFFSYYKSQLGRLNWFNFVVPLEKMHTAFKSFKDIYGLLIDVISVSRNI